MNTTPKKPRHTLQTIKGDLAAMAVKHGQEKEERLMLQKMLHDETKKTQRLEDLVKASNKEVEDLTEKLALEVRRQKNSAEWAQKHYAEMIQAQAKLSKVPNFIKKFFKAV